MHDLGLQAAGLGFLSASYFYAYMPMQFPAGLLYDRFGPRLLLTMMIALCAGGALLFSQSDYLTIIALGRMMMGFGSAFAFIGTLVLVSRWFPASYFPVLTGIVQAMSSAGALLGTTPLAAAVEDYGWQGSIFALAMIGFILAIMAWLFVRDSPSGYVAVDCEHKKGHEWMRLLSVCKHSQTWLVGIYAFAMWAPIIVFAELWGVTYLSALYSMTRIEASVYMNYIWIGIAVGSPLLGFFSQWLKQRHLPLYLMSLLGLGSSVFLIYSPAILSSFVLSGLMLCIGFSAAGSILTFSVVKENNHPSAVGSAIGFNNMMVVAGGALLQPLVGVILDQFWDGQIIDHIPIYSMTAYRWSMLTIPACYLLAMILAIFGIRESFYKDMGQ
jgi:MFS family permease